MQFHEVHVQSECFQIMFLYWAYNSLVLKKAFLQILNDIHRYITWSLGFIEIL